MEIVNRINIICYIGLCKQSIWVIVMKKTEKLDNGINLITHKLSNTHCITISVNFKVGSIYEPAENNGITHLIEHLFFRQWDNLNQEKLYYERM